MPSDLKIGSSNVTLAADHWGEESATPVVLLHGGGQTRHSWRATGRDLAAAGWYAVAADLRGHGDSDWSPDGDYGLDRMTQDVSAIAGFLGRPPVLVGASLGGISALAALGRHPDLALGLVLVDVSPFVQAGGSGRIHAFMTSHAGGFETIEQAADAVAAYLPHRPRPKNPEGLRKNLRERDGRLYWHWDPAMMRHPTDDPVQRNRRIDPARLGGAASSLRIPTLLVRGGASDVLSVTDAQRFLEMVPHAEFHDVAGAHHMVAGDDNAVFAGVLGSFLERRVRSRLELLARPV